MSRRTLTGTGATPRAAVGTVVWYDRDSDLGDPDETSVDPPTELERFEDAREAARAELEAERERTAERVGEQEAGVFDAHLQFLDDPQIESGVTSAVENDLPAEHAVKRAFADPIEQFQEMDGRMAERADDLRDVRDRLIRLLTGSERVDLGDLPNGAVVLAERLTPSDTAQLDPDRVAGFATVTGGRTSHAAIFARSLALPAVVGIGDELREVEEDATVVVDGETGELCLDPTDERREEAATASEVDVRTDPVSTVDGTTVEVAANVGQPAELDGVRAQGADGIGLYRTEFLFLDRQSPPDEDEQYDAYTTALDTFPDGRVIVRTLDIGGDKPIPYLNLPDEENPFLGERGIRRSLDSDTELFETQLRALLRAAADGDGELAIMFPLVTTVDELDAALETVDAVATQLDAENVTHAVPELGVMIETPSAVFAAPELAERVDFLSVGTNDLTQYTMAAARGNENVEALRDPTQPAVLRAIARTVEAAHENDAWVGMCGEMAGDPDLTELLVGLGFDELSMSAVTIPDVKAAVQSVHTDEASAHATHALDAATREQIRTQLDE
ncbi:phosphoenolpyruvate--protein phosphotransferase [Natrialba taiwanensis]|uniref:Phosphoenolpyruvate-protein phosphotransferase n=1 Tax=Natrialba taiwanensis DSM 12281 TaxID=1230458 RepID=M0AD89_9EURY|nr:phosphoenolpyruvate--protein phosphotransferase [Natrialba taiwanensis]ELY96361.1 phosphoenolpyruvate-protein phosphotransferase [Natrialba taiwanensis DSM 12281]